MYLYTVNRRYVFSYDELKKGKEEIKILRKGSKVPTGKKTGAKKVRESGKRRIPGN
jgi:hypothetical protein